MFLDAPSNRLIRPALKKALRHALHQYRTRPPGEGLTGLVERITGARLLRSRTVREWWYLAETDTIFCGSGAVHTLLHEICHSLQKKAGAYAPRHRRVSEKLLLEQECQSATVWLYKQLLPHRPVTDWMQEMYFTVPTALLLKEYYSEQLVDDLLGMEYLPRLSMLKYFSTFADNDISSTNRCCPNTTTPPR